MTEVGKVSVVATRGIGTTLVGDHASGVTVLHVLDRIEFAEEGGQLLIGAETLTFDPWSGDTDLQPLALTSPTTAAHEDGTGVFVVPAATKTIATVVIDGEGEGIEAEVPHNMVAQLSEGIRGDEQETVEVEAGGSGWVVVNIVKESGLYDASAAPIVTATDDGERVQIDGDGITLYTDDAVQTLVFTTTGNPYGIAVNAAGFIFVADATKSKVRKFDPNGAEVTTGGFPISTSGTPHGVAVDAAGFIYAATNTPKIQKFTSAGVQVTTGGFPISLPGQPFGVRIDSTGKIYTADVTNKLVRKYSTAGVQVTTGGFPMSTVGQPGRLALDTADNVYVTDVDNNLVRKFNTAGAQTLSFGTIGQAYGLAVDSAGDIWVGDTYTQGGLLRQFDPSGTQVLSIPSPFPNGLTTDAQDFIYAVDNGNFVVRKYNNPGHLLASAKLDSALGRLLALNAIISGNLEVDSITSANGLQILSPIDALQKVQADVNVPGTIHAGNTSEPIDILFPTPFPAGVVPAVNATLVGHTTHGYTITVSDTVPASNAGFEVNLIRYEGASTASDVDLTFNWTAIAP